MQINLFKLSIIFTEFSKSRKIIFFYYIQIADIKKFLTYL